MQQTGGRISHAAVATASPRSPTILQKSTIETKGREPIAEKHLHMIRWVVLFDMVQAYKSCSGKDMLNVQFRKQVLNFALL